MKRVRVGKEFHYLKCPEDFADLVEKHMGTDSAELFRNVVTAAQDAQTFLEGIDLDAAVNPDYPYSDSDYALSEAVDSLISITNW